MFKVSGPTVFKYFRGDWLDGEILSVKEGRQGYPLVTVHLEDGNDETVDIGYVVLKGKDYDRKDKHKSSRKKDRSRSRSRTRTRSRSSSSSYRRRRRRERSSSRESHPRDDTHDSKSKKEDLIREFKRREREKALAVGKVISIIIHTFLGLWQKAQFLQVLTILTISLKKILILILF